MGVTERNTGNPHIWHSRYPRTDAP